METYHLAMANDCPLDDDFFKILEHVANKKGMTTYRIQAHNLEETLRLLRSGQIGFLSYYDRASDTASEFYTIQHELSEKPVFHFINLDRQCVAADKSLMHERFVRSNINVPKTIILPEYDAEPSIYLENINLEFIGSPFVIKPSLHTGAGDGVLTEVTILDDIKKKRIEFPQDKYFLQEKIIPKEENSRRFWFRIFFVCDTIIHTWWNDQTHRYQSFSAEDHNLMNTEEINTIMTRIYKICGLNFFSTELAITENDKIYAVDYVNEICDMRLQSRYFDGVPDEIVSTIAEKIVTRIQPMLQDDKPRNFDVS
jgi:hypothetical protein